MSSPYSIESSTKIPLFGLFFANAVSSIGDSLTLVAIPWFVYETTGSAAKMGIVGFFTFLPRVVSTFLGGSIIDRIGFKRISVIADIMSGFSVFCVPLLHQIGRLSFPLLILLVFSGAFFDGPGTTARESLLPDLSKIAHAKLERVNASFQMVQRTSLFVGPALAGLLIAAIGSSNLLFVDAASFAASALVIVICVSTPHSVLSDEDTSKDRSYIHDIATGFRFILSDRLLLTLAVVLSMLNFFDAPLSSVLLPVFTRQIYGSANSLGFLISMLGIGAVVSTLLYASFGHRLTRRWVFVSCFILLGLPYWILALAPPYPFALLAVLIMGLAAGPINPILMTVRQERVPEHVRARVFGTFTSIAYLVIPLGQLLGGIAVEAWGPQIVFLSIALCYLAVTVRLGFDRSLKEMDRINPNREA